MTPDELFEAFGGKQGVMDATGQARNTVTHWLRAGVPWRHWPALKRAAAKGRIPGITDETLAGTRIGNKPPRARARPRCSRAA